ncbi:MAG: insulinase family protein [Phycisphaerae bacterium]
MSRQSAVWWVAATLVASSAMRIDHSATAVGAPGAARDDLVDRVRFERLDRGLRVCAVVEPGQSLVSVQLWFAAGAAAEPADGLGVAEELRRARETRRDAALRLRATGAAFEGRVLRDATVFAAVAPLGQLPALIPVFAELATPLAPEDLRRNVFDGARSAITIADFPSAERAGFGGARVGADWPSATRGDLGLSHATWSRVLNALFAGHPYRHAPAAGSVPAGDRVAPDSAGGNAAAPAEGAALGAREALRREFEARWLVSGNATLFIVGDVDREAVFALARESLAGVAWREPPRRAFADRPVADTIRVDDGDTPAGARTLAFLTPAWGYAENATLDVLMHHLCNPVDGVLALRLAALGAPPPRWDRFAWRDAGVLLLALQPRVDGDAARGGADLLEIWQEVLESVRSTPISAVPLRRARSLAARDQREAQACFRDYAWRLAAHEILGGDLLQADFEAGQVARVTVGDVAAAASRLAETRCVVVAGIGGAARPPRGAPPDAGGSGAPGDARRARKPAPPAENRTLSPIETLRRLSAAGAANVESPLPELVTQDATERDWSLRCTSTGRAGGASIALSAAGVAPMTAALLGELGSARRSSNELRDYFTYHGLSWRVVPSSDGSTMVIDGPAERLAQMTELLVDLVHDPRVEAGSVATAERRMRRAALAFSERAAAVADRLAFGLVAPCPTWALAETRGAELARFSQTRGDGRRVLIAAPGRAAATLDDVRQVLRDATLDATPREPARPSSSAATRPSAELAAATPPDTAAALSRATTSPSSGATPPARFGGFWPVRSAAHETSVPILWQPREGEVAELRVVVSRIAGGRQEADDAWRLLLGWPAELPGEIAPGVPPRWRVLAGARGIAVLTARVAAGQIPREIADACEHLRWVNTPSDEQRELAAFAGRLARVHAAIAADGPRGALLGLLRNEPGREAASSAGTPTSEFLILGVVVVGGDAALAAPLREMGAVVPVSAD